MAACRGIALLTFGPCGVGATDDDTRILGRRRDRLRRSGEHWCAPDAASHDQRSRAPSRHLEGLGLVRAERPVRGQRGDPATRPPAGRGARLPPELGGRRAVREPDPDDRHRDRPRPRADLHRSVLHAHPGRHRAVPERGRFVPAAAVDRRARRGPGRTAALEPAGPGGRVHPVRRAQRRPPHPGPQGAGRPVRRGELERAEGRRRPADQLRPIRPSRCCWTTSASSDTRRSRTSADRSPSCTSNSGSSCSPNAAGSAGSG